MCSSSGQSQEANFPRNNTTRKKIRLRVWKGMYATLQTVVIVWKFVIDVSGQIIHVVATYIVQDLLVDFWWFLSFSPGRELLAGKDARTYRVKRVAGSWPDLLLSWGFSWPGVQTGQPMLKPLDVSKVVVTGTRQSFALDLQPTSHLNHSESTSDLHRYGTFCVRNYSLNPRQQPCKVNATFNLHF